MELELELASKRLAELGHSTRLTIFRHLVRCSPRGCRVGDLQETLRIPGSTLSHHLGRLISVGLIEQQRDGRVLYCLPKIDVFNETVAYLTQECCEGSFEVDSTCAPSPRLAKTNRRKVL